MKKRYLFLSLLLIADRIFSAQPGNQQTLQNYQVLVQEYRFNRLMKNKIYSESEKNESEQKKKELEEKNVQEIHCILQRNPSFVNYAIDNEIPLSLAIIHQDNTTLDVLLRYRADINQRLSRNHLPAIHLAALHVNLYAVCKLLEIDSELANLIESAGNTTLLQQLFLRNEELLEEMSGLDSITFNVQLRRKTIDIAEKLIDLSSIDILNHKDKSGRTALHLAVIKNYPEIVEKILLRRKGLKYDSKDERNYTPLEYAIDLRNIEIVEVLSNKRYHHIFDLPCSKEDFIRLLKNDCQGLDLSKMLISYLYKSVPNNRYSIPVIKFLLQKGADLNVRNGYGVTPLKIAVRNNNFEIAKLLLEKGADPNVRDSDGLTVLMIALYENKLNIVRLLLEKGADANLINSDGKTALDIARERQNLAMINLLQSYTTDTTDKTTSCIIQ